MDLTEQKQSGDGGAVSVFPADNEWPKSVNSITSARGIFHHVMQELCNDVDVRCLWLKNKGTASVVQE